MYYNSYLPPQQQPNYYNNGAMPDNLAMLKNQNQYQYQPTFPTYQQQPLQAIQNQPMQPQNNNSGMIWVDNEQEAFSYPIAPNTAVALWDNYNSAVYLKKSDASGKTTTEIYDLVKRQPLHAQNQAVGTLNNMNSTFVSREEFNALEAKLNGFISGRNEAVVMAVETAPTSKAKKIDLTKESEG